MSSIRTATALTLGVVTLALTTFIRVSGLEDIIIHGLNINDKSLNLASAIPTAFLAFVLDLIIKYSSKSLHQKV